MMNLNIKGITFDCWDTVVVDSLENWVEERIWWMQEILKGVVHKGRADEAYEYCKYGQYPQRDRHNAGGFVRMNFRARSAEQDEEYQPEHIEGRQEACYRCYSKQDRMAVVQNFGQYLIF